MFHFFSNAFFDFFEKMIENERTKRFCYNQDRKSFNSLFQEKEKGMPFPALPNL